MMAFLHGIVYGIPHFLGFPNAARFWFWIALISGLAFLITLILVPFLILLLPSDVFIVKEDEEKKHFFFVFLTKIVRNILGVFLLALGFLFLFLPGQGLFTILLGVLLVDFKSKKKWVRALMTRPHVLTTLNWFRVKYNKEPFNLDEEK